MATIEVPNRYLALAPVIVTAPSVRCGSTLVQRLLTASENGFIYGEEIGSQMMTLTNLLIGQMRIVEERGDALDADFQDALAGPLVNWRPFLTPPAKVLLQGWVEAYYQVPMAIAAHSDAVGRPVWGFKYPSYSCDVIRALLHMMPRARVVYVFRNLYDVLKSAKARRFVKTPAEVEALCVQWAGNLNQAADLAQDERVLFIRYEHLLDRPAEHLKLLELATGVQGIDPAVLDIRINTFEGAPESGFSPTQYVDPADLTDADLATIREKAAAVMGTLYPDLGLAV